MAECAILMRMRKTARWYVLVALCGFVLDLPWEYVVLPLYTGYERLGSGASLVAWASLGDALYIVLIALAVALVRRRFDWTHDARVRDYLLASAFGFFVALAVEYKAFYLHRWAYAAAMPVVPVLHVGLAPVAQMVLLAPLSLFLSRLVMAE